MHICIVSNAMTDQNQWRDYPDNIPTEDVLMAVEYYYKWENPDKNGPQRSCWIYIKGQWYWRDGAFLDRPVDIESKANIRFKPW